MRIGILILLTTILIALMISCKTEQTHIYVPGQKFTERLIVFANLPQDRNLKVGEWLELKATRTTGPWVKVDKSQKSQYGCWWLQPPPEVDGNAQSNVTWHVEPSGSAEFNIPGASTLHKRSVRFTQPGRYKLSATSAGCGKPFHSKNVIEITVGKSDGKE